MDRARRVRVAVAVTVLAVSAVGLADGLRCPYAWVQLLSAGDTDRSDGQVRIAAATAAPVCGRYALTPAHVYAAWREYKRRYAVYACVRPDDEEAPLTVSVLNVRDVRELPQNYVNTRVAALAFDSELPASYEIGRREDGGDVDVRMAQAVLCDFNHCRTQTALFWRIGPYWAGRTERIASPGKSGGALVDGTGRLIGLLEGTTGGDLPVHIFVDVTHVDCETVRSLFR